MGREQEMIVAVYQGERARFESGTAIVTAIVIPEEELNQRVRASVPLPEAPPGTDSFLNAIFGSDDECWGTGEEIAIKVDCEPGELLVDQEYLWRGKWFDHEAYGRQFHASSFVLRQPHGRTGVIAYLARAGEGNGMGKGKAEGLWNIFGANAVTMMRTQPLVCVQELYKHKLYLHEKEALAIAEILRQSQHSEKCQLDLMDVLDGRGFPKETARNCLQTWGVRASQTVRRDPYKLMLFPRCGFRRCDAAYLELGHNPLRMKRQALAAWYAVRVVGQGNTWVPMTVATCGVKQYIGGAGTDPAKAIKLALGRGGRGRILAAANTKGQSGPISETGKFEWVAEAGKAFDEADLAKMVARSFAESARWPDQLCKE